ncbi:MAG TPA: toll/interleukin-1 receptor domain-containing protein [Thermoanaerobaculia bacterium]|nr:toll/interleukin-1 receptor domain-containing protein [Thermoanaerobaculia bacterium]
MAINPAVPFDVFLSHAHLDAEAVELLGRRLEDQAHLRVWLDRWVLVPGEPWQQGMSKGLDEAKTCAVCIGRHTPAGWFREEIEKALNRQTKEKEFRVIPVILPEGDRTLIDNFLELRTWVDFKNGLADGSAFHILVSGIRGLPPGRYPSVESDEVIAIREKLLRIRAFRQEQLIDDSIAQEYQRRVLDQIMEPKR